VKSGKPLFEASMKKRKRETRFGDRQSPAERGEKGRGCQRFNGKEKTDDTGTPRPSAGKEGFQLKRSAAQLPQKGKRFKRIAKREEQGEKKSRRYLCLE